MEVQTAFKWTPKWNGTEKMLFRLLDEYCILGKTGPEACNEDRVQQVPRTGRVILWS